MKIVKTRVGERWRRGGGRDELVTHFRDPRKIYNSPRRRFERDGQKQQRGFYCRFYRRSKKNARTRAELNARVEIRARSPRDNERGLTSPLR